MEGWIRARTAAGLCAVWKKHWIRGELESIRMRYGLDGGEARTQRETAAALGYSRSYISRIEKKALEKMRRNMEKRGESYEIG